MPLDRAHVRRASRYAVPAFPVFMITVGLSMGLAPIPRLIETPAFRYADQLLSIRWWAIGFLTIAALMLAAMITRSRRTYQIGLDVITVWMTLWALIAAAAFLDDRASPSAWVWPAMVAWFAWTTLVDLEDRTGDQ